MEGEERGGIIPCWNLPLPVSLPLAVFSGSGQACAAPIIPHAHACFPSHQPVHQAVTPWGLGCIARLCTHREQSRDSGGHGSARCLSVPWGVLQTMLSFCICFETEQPVQIHGLGSQRQTWKSPERCWSRTSPGDVLLSTLPATARAGALDLKFI